MEDERPWYFKDSTVIWAALLFLVFALPLVWLSPYYSTRRKVVVTVAILVGTYVSWVATAFSLKTLEPYLQSIKQGL